MPEAQIRAGLATFELGQLFGKLGRVGMAVAGVDEAVRSTLAEGIDMVEISRAIDHAQVERWDQRRTGRLDPRGTTSAAKWTDE